MNKQKDLIKQQLSSVQFADLSNYDKETNTYYIPKINQIKLKINHQYIIKIKDSLYFNDILKTNYNNNSVPPFNCYLIDIMSILNRIIKVNAIEYDIENNKTLSNSWGGYLSIKDIEIIREV